MILWWLEGPLGCVDPQGAVLCLVGATHPPHEACWVTGPLVSVSTGGVRLLTTSIRSHTFPPDPHGDRVSHTRSLLRASPAAPSSQARPARKATLIHTSRLRCPDPSSSLQPRPRAELFCGPCGSAPRLPPPLKAPTRVSRPQSACRGPAWRGAVQRRPAAPLGLLASASEIGLRSQRQGPVVTPVFRINPDKEFF